MVLIICTAIVFISYYLNIETNLLSLIFIFSLVGLIFLFLVLFVIIYNLVSMIFIEKCQKIHLKLNTIKDN